MSTEKNAAKDKVRHILDQLPEETTLEEIQYHIYIQQKIDRGLEDVEAGRTLSQEEAEKRLAKWIER